MNAEQLVDKLRGHVLLDEVSCYTEIYMRTPGGLRKLTEVTVEESPLSIAQRALNKQPKKVIVLR